jgi:hypothetical protein
MNLLSSNCQGLGQPWTVQELTHLAREFCPEIVFLSETKQQKTRVLNIKSRLGLNNCFIVDSHGKGSGLAMFWNDSMKLDILLYGLHHIDTLIWSEGRHAAW